ncbi:pro-cathepsin H-like [Leguminivora glycinivorella]|uniref:pro-cathepsin H-like n=1 Tax=Leguminivora glycinivorella TaxID=1035111 RepID=UPI00200BFA34|nr:pro-cathepsin H-like [Leguminivora glycinivorella]
MLVPILFWVAICIASSAVMAASNLDKPYYDLDNAENLFKKFIKEYGKLYEGNDYFERLEIFKENLKDINRRNEKYSLAVFKVNRLADLKPEELHNTRSGYFKNFNENTNKVAFPPGTTAAPKSFDWRTHGKVTRVKDMGIRACYGCTYLFSATGNIEGQYAIKYNQTVSLSEEQALDCCFDNDGIFGGSPCNLMNDFARRTGIMLESDYPFVGERGYCHEDNAKVAVGVIEGFELDTMDEDVLKQNLYDIGPLSICFFDEDFFFYKEGIVEPDTCGNDYYYNPCALLVGYGEENGTDYWTLKFSYGPEWGEEGYGRLRRGINACGIGYYTYTATIA